jgi:hypothetical protein
VDGRGDIQDHREYDGFGITFRPLEGWGSTCPVQPSVRPSRPLGGMIREPIEHFLSPNRKGEYTVRRLEDFSAREIRAARWRTIGPRLRLWWGRNQYRYRGSIADASRILADLNLATGREIGLVQLENRTYAIVRGRAREIDPNLIRGGVRDFIAHTHGSGILIPSGNIARGQNGDLVVWGLRRQTRAFIVGPDGSAVLWESPSRLWTLDITATILGPVTR